MQPTSTQHWNTSNQPAPHHSPIKWNGRRSVSPINGVRRTKAAGTCRHDTLHHAANSTPARAAHCRNCFSRRVQSLGGRCFASASASLQSMIRRRIEVRHSVYDAAAPAAAPLAAARAPRYFDLRFILEEKSAGGSGRWTALRFSPNAIDRPRRAAGAITFLTAQFGIGRCSSLGQSTFISATRQ